jgi:hypothetical protein
VQAETEGKTQVVRLSASDVEDLAAPVKSLMAPFALKYRFEKELEGSNR